MTTVSIEHSDKPVYNAARIAWELQQTATGGAFYGNALRVAKDMPDMSAEDRSVLDRFATGLQRSTDHIALQDIALRIVRSAGQAGRIRYSPP